MKVSTDDEDGLSKIISPVGLFSCSYMNCGIVDKTVFSIQHLHLCCSLKYPESFLQTMLFFYSYNR